MKLLKDMSDKGIRIDEKVLACSRCNMAKGDIFTYSQMKEIAEKYFRGGIK